MNNSLYLEDYSNEDIIEKNPSKKIISCYDDLNVKF